MGLNMRYRCLKTYLGTAMPISTIFRRRESFELISKSEDGFTCLSLGMSESCAPATKEKHANARSKHIRNLMTKILAEFNAGPKFL
jgi:hypothetical protein